MTESRHTFFDCDCNTHAVAVFYGGDSSFPIIAIEWWVNGGADWSIWDRLRYAWQVVRHGRLLAYEVVLTPDNALRMADNLRDVAVMAKGQDE